MASDETAALQPKRKVPLAERNALPGSAFAKTQETLACIMLEAEAAYASNFWQGRHKSANAIAQIMIASQAMGVTVFEGLSGMYTTPSRDGKSVGSVALEGKFLTDLMNTRKAVIVEPLDPPPGRTPNDWCAMRVERRDGGFKPCTIQFTKEDAELAGLWGSATWQKYPGDMLWWKCISRVVRRICPEVIGAATVRLPGEEDEVWEPHATVTQEAPSIAPPPVRRTERVGSAGVDAFWRRVTEVAAAVGQDPDDLQADVERWIAEHRQQSHVPDRLAEWPVDELQVMRDRLLALLESEPTLPIDLFDVEATAEDGGD